MKHQRILFLMVALAIAVAFTACDKVVINDTTDNNQIVGSDKDEHGCLGSAGYSWCALKNKCLRIWEEACDEKLTNDLRQAFMDKYQKKIEDIQVTVALSTETHARGGVKFGADKEVEGGNFLAAKVNDKWQIVFDGNGGISCSLLRQYNFSSDMMEDCVEE